MNLALSLIIAVVLILFSALSRPSNPPPTHDQVEKAHREACFRSGGYEYHTGISNETFYNVCVYRNQ